MAIQLKHRAQQRNREGSPTHMGKDNCSQTEVKMVDRACQTEMPYTANSLQKIKCIPLADLRHAVSNDHSYASSDVSGPNEEDASK